MRKIILPIFALFLLAFGACSNEDEIDYEVLLRGVTITDLTAVREGEKIVVTWAVPDYEHLAGFVAEDNNTSSTLEVPFTAGAATATCEFDATPGNHAITVRAKDVQSNLSAGSTVEIYINNVGDVYNLVKNSADPANPVIDVYKNGEPMNLGLEASGIILERVIVSGQDIYIAGSRKNEFNKYEALYFKNSTINVLASSETADYRAYGIFVQGEDVYVSGYAGQKTNNNVVVWKNGVLEEYSDAAYNLVIDNSITVSGSDVYVAFNTIDISVSPYQLKLNVSKNGSVSTVVQYDYPSAEAQALESITVQGDDVYAVTTNGYFKNGEFVGLNSNSGNARASELYVNSNGDVYVCGTENVGGVYQARIWENGGMVELTTGQSNRAVFMSAYNGDVYVTATVLDDAKGYNTILNWKNGTQETVYDAAESFCYGIGTSERPL